VQPAPGFLEPMARRGALPRSARSAWGCRKTASVPRARFEVAYGSGADA